MPDPITPERAKVIGARWRWAGLASILLAGTLSLVGFRDLFLPVVAAGVLCVHQFAEWHGWRAGYAAREANDVAAPTVQVRAQLAEKIARAIEVGRGERCPDCGGKPASLKWGNGFKRLGRCGAGHTWVHGKGDWLDPAEVAREHAKEVAADD